jgi:hypothetical protein
VEERELESEVVAQRDEVPGPIGLGECSWAKRRGMYLQAAQVGPREIARPNAYICDWLALRPRSVRRSSRVA